MQLPYNHVHDRPVNGFVRIRSTLSSQSSLHIICVSSMLFHFLGLFDTSGNTSSLFSTPMATLSRFARHQWPHFLALFDPSGNTSSLCSTPVATLPRFVRHQWQHFLALFDTSGNTSSVCSIPVATLPRFV
jgi:hypothetical protein